MFDNDSPALIKLRALCIEKGLTPTDATEFVECTEYMSRAAVLGEGSIDGTVDAYHKMMRLIDKYPQMGKDSDDQ